MQLPQIKYRGVQSLGRRDSSTFVNAKLAEALPAKAIAELASETSKSISIIEEVRTKQQVREGEFSVSDDAFTVAKENEGKTAYSRDELPEGVAPEYDTVEVATPGGENEEAPRQTIPAYEVYPTLYKKQVERSISRAASRIDNATARQEFVQRQTLELERRHADLVIKATKQQEEYNRAVEIQAVDEARGKRDYLTALERIKTSPYFTPAERKAKTLEVKTERELDGYRDLILNGTDDEILDAVNGLQAKDYGGILTTKTRVAAANALGGELTSRATKAKAKNKAERQRTKYDLDNTVEALNTVAKVDMAEVLALSTRVQKDLDPKDLWELQDAVKDSNIMQAVYSQSPARIEQYISTMESREALSVEEARVLKKLKSTQADQISLIKRNTWSAGSRAGIVDFEPLTFDLQEDNFMEQMIARGVEYDTLLGTYGQVNGLMTSDEAAKLSTAISGMTDGQQLELFRQVNEGLAVSGRGKAKVKAFYDQLKTKGMNSLAIAGRIYSEGDEGLARTILEGRRLLHPKAGEQEVKLRRYETEYKGAINELIGPDAYADTPATRQALIDSTVALAVGMAAQRGDFSGEFRRSDFREAMEAIQPMATFRRSKIPVPFRSMDPDQFSSWLKNDLNPDYIEALGGVQKYTGPQFLKSLNKGEIVLKAVGENQYLVREQSETGGYLHGADGTPFIFRYDADIAVETSVSYAGRKAGEKAERKESVKRQVLEEKD